jgi:integrase/recombinase XerD
LVIKTERFQSITAQAIVNMFQRWYRHLGFVGCSSHSGRRTFITNAARKISTVGGSLRDVQQLAGHSNLRTTERYIDENPDAQIRVVSSVYTDFAKQTFKPLEGLIARMTPAK